MQVVAQIQVLDVNDNAPFFSVDMYTYNALESLPNPSTLFTVTADDLDSGVNAQVSYSISPNHEHGPSLPFEVHAVSGEVQ